MNETISDSFSEDETDIYVNSVARLKALRKKPTREAGPTFEGCKKKSDSCTAVRHRDEGFDRPLAGSSKENALQDHHTSIKSSSQRVKENKDSVVIDLDEDSGDVPVENHEDDNYEIDVKVYWRSQTVHRISMLRHDSLEKIFQYFASLEGIPAEQVLIMRNEMTIKRTDTPALLNLTVIDILEGGIVSAAVVAQPEHGAEQEALKNECSIKVQISSKEAIVVPLKRDERFTRVIAKCAELLNVKESKIKLYFDGERIDENETPEALEFEEEACIDLHL